MQHYPTMRRTRCGQILTLITPCATQEDGDEHRERPTWMQSNDGSTTPSAERAIVSVGVAPGSATAAVSAFSFTQLAWPAP